MAVDKEKNAQFLLTVPKGMLKDIEKHQENGSFMNRNDAVRDLIKKGLSKEKYDNHD